MFNNFKLNKMKNLFFFLSLVILLGGCQDSILHPEDALTTPTHTSRDQSCMPRIIANSEDEVRMLIDLAKSESNFSTRAASVATISNNEEEFVSLVEAKKKEIMSSLTPEELEIVKNDPDGLELCLEDSVIADIHFAMLLNADREIQVGKTVYKYLPNGIASTPEEFISELKTAEEITSNILVTDENAGIPQNIGKNLTFIPTRYIQQKMDRNITDVSVDGGYGGSSSQSSTKPATGGESTAEGIVLDNGVTIPSNQIREVNYDDNGDGSWVHRTWTGFWGKNVLACNNFSSNKRLSLSLYDQNYLIYANIGSSVKMQKRVLGIWWNTKAEEVVHGWETIAIEYKLPKAILPTFSNPFNNQNEYPTCTWNLTPFGKNKELLLTIPFINYDFTTSDLNKAFKAGVKFVWDRANNEIKKLVNNDSKKVGLIIFNDLNTYVVGGPFSIARENTNKLETKYDAQWFPNTYEFGFSYGSSFKFTPIKLGKDDGVSLYRGCVFGAVKYNGRWLGAKIKKDK